MFQTSCFFIIYDVKVFVIYHFSSRTVAHYMVISFSNKMAHQLTRQNWLKPANCRDFIDKDSWLPNLNPLDFHVWGAMLEAYNS